MLGYLSAIFFYYVLFSFSYLFFRNRIAILSYSSCARCQANASSQHKRGKVDSNAPLTACAVHLVCPTAGCSSVVQSSFVVKKKDSG